LLASKNKLSNSIFCLEDKFPLSPLWEEEYDEFCPVLQEKSAKMVIERINILRH
jgi:hypothetical protein